MPTSLLRFLIKRIDYTTARIWIEQWHYSHVIPKGRNICFGLFDRDNLYAVIVYGNGINPYQAAYLNVGVVVEIKRMCRSEPAQDYPLSRFIALTSRFLMKEYPYDAIVAFADPEQGYEGTVYKAAGFTKLGTTQAEWHVVDAQGVRHHRRLAYRHSKRHNISIEESRQALGLTRVKTKPKHRWVKYATNKSGPKKEVQ